MSIGKRTSDNGVHVHEKRVSTCTAALLYVAVFVAVPALSWRRAVPIRGQRRWTGATPPFGPPGSAPGGALPSKLSLREGGGVDEESRDAVVP